MVLRNGRISRKTIRWSTFQFVAACNYGGALVSQPQNEQNSKRGEQLLRNESSRTSVVSNLSQVDLHTGGFCSHSVRHPHPWRRFKAPKILENLEKSRNALKRLRKQWKTSLGGS